uniref:Uncharacterized protein n=1 Tax=Chromera velia CCMP2878 TaxID=1169474 RepID=A0A0G4FZE2_9ALVE|eukprot:Cvel_3960.t1-p1 / transcript=Cvel_3960.t1 / gene=Cvel_3960 / organism=Chromera_velia_CCMP2878 / gene_product=hypothetical protein / transcript_product=hypothetical protein / location=Cvel_scaffold168:47192-47863(+) / protein_length=224 / sequence_SO=supercontig / SO=protein_coding / is_pseudo=false
MRLPPLPAVQDRGFRRRGGGSGGRGGGGRGGPPPGGRESGRLAGRSSAGRGRGSSAPRGGRGGGGANPSGPGGRGQGPSHGQGDPGRGWRLRGRGMVSQACSFLRSCLRDPSTSPSQKSVRFSLPDSPVGGKADRERGRRKQKAQESRAKDREEGASLRESSVSSASTMQTVMERFSPRPWKTGPRFAPEGNPPDPWWPTLPIHGTAYGLVHPSNMPYEPFPTM